jgi:hypothetical protein
VSSNPSRPPKPNPTPGQAYASQAPATREAGATATEVVAPPPSPGAVPRPTGKRSTTDRQTRTRRKALGPLPEWRRAFAEREAAGEPDATIGKALSKRPDVLSRARRDPRHAVAVAEARERLEHKAKAAREREAAQSPLARMQALAIQLRSLDYERELEEMRADQTRRCATDVLKSATAASPVAAAPTSAEATGQPATAETLQRLDAAIEAAAHRRAADIAEARAAGLPDPLPMRHVANHKLGALVSYPRSALDASDTEAAAYYAAEHRRLDTIAHVNDPIPASAIDAAPKPQPVPPALPASAPPTLPPGWSRGPDPSPRWRR